MSLAPRQRRITAGPKTLSPRLQHLICSREYCSVSDFIKVHAVCRVGICSWCWGASPLHKAPLITSKPDWVGSQLVTSPSQVTNKFVVTFSEVLDVLDVKDCVWCWVIISNLRIESGPVVTSDSPSNQCDDISDSHAYLLIACYLSCLPF
jgi:hypothetical protein